jgi:hypothetical protein
MNPMRGYYKTAPRSFDHPKIKHSASCCGLSRSEQAWLAHCVARALDHSLSFAFDLYSAPGRRDMFRGVTVIQLKRRQLSP